MTIASQCLICVAVASLGCEPGISVESVEVRTERLGGEKPSVAVTILTPVLSLTKENPIPVNIIFAESVSGFEAADIQLDNAKLVGFSGEGAVYSLTVSPVFDGEVAVEVAAGVATNDRGDENAAAELVLIYDSKPPAKPDIAIDNGADQGSDSEVVLTLTATEAVEMYVTNLESCEAGGSWEKYQSSRLWTLGQTNSEAAVFVKYRDKAGNESACVGDTIIHDDTGPQFTSPTISDDSELNVAFTVNEKARVKIYGDESCTSALSVEVSFDAGEHVITLAQNLKNEVTEFFVRGIDSLGNASACEKVENNIQYQLPAPDTPSVTAQATSLTLSWPTVEGADSYNLYWSLTSNVSLPANVLEGVSSAYEHTGLTTGMSYYYRVAAVKSGVVGKLSPVVHGVPSNVPSVPQNLTAKVDSFERISLSWSAPEDNGGAVVDDYIVEFSTDGTDWHEYGDGLSASTSATVTGLSGGTEYWFRVLAVNQAGSSAASESAEASTLSSFWSDVTAASDTTLRDERTGVWWSSEQSGNWNWSEAGSLCDDLNWNGHSDWQLPTIIELQNAFDNRLNTELLLEDSTELLLEDSSGAIWSSSDVINDAQSAYGYSLQGSLISRPKDEAGIVLCVRKPPWSDVSIGSDTTLIDSDTGLWWSSVQKAKSWQESKDYCDVLTYNGVSAWRLPNINELQVAASNGLELSLPGVWSSSSEDGSESVQLIQPGGETFTSPKNGSYPFYCVADGF